MAGRPVNDSTPPPFELYSKWLHRKFRRVPGVAEGQAYYEVVTSSLKAQFESSEFWLDLQARLPDFEAAYYVETGLGLLAFPHSGHVETKSWESFLAKTYRRNVLRNPSFPDEPSGGWLLPPTWFSATKDVVRTMFVVKYLDGVQELRKRVETLAAEHRLNCESTLEGTPAGYYAGHLVVTANLKVPTTSWAQREAPVPVELQVTTQIKEVIKGLLYRTYRLDRMQVEDDLEWQWEYDGRPFAANYLGHILHYVEGRIMNVRRLDADPEKP